MVRGVNMENNGFIKVEDKQPCIICGKLTNLIEIDFECRICSDECCMELINRYLEDVK